MPTKGIDQKTGKPLDYDPNRDVQVYSGVANPTKDAPVKRLCPNRTGGNNFWPTSYSQKTKLRYIPAMTACEDVTHDRELAKSRKVEGWFERSGSG
jgi:alcohol dehydrogenase (cytochrome c)